MSEAAIASEADFDAAREAELGPVDDQEQNAAPEGEEDGAEAKSKDWQKIAHDKEGVAARERSRRREAERRAKDLEDRLSKLESQSKGGDPLEAILKQLREDSEDPIGDLESLKKLAKQLLSERSEGRQAEAATTAQQRALMALSTAMEDAEADFSRDHPDYQEAAKYFRADKEAELKDLGYAGQKLQERLAQELYGVVQTALNAGRDPAETVYAMAKRRGFASERREAETKLAQIADAARSGGGRTAAAGAPRTLTWSYVSNLKGAERDAAWAKLREQERRAG